MTDNNLPNYLFVCSVCGEVSLKVKVNHGLECQKCFAINSSKKERGKYE